MGEGEAREKSDPRCERGGNAVLSSALEKMKAVSVRLRWYRLNGLPGEKGGVLRQFQLACRSKCMLLSRCSVHTTVRGSRAGGTL